MTSTVLLQTRLSDVNTSSAVVERPQSPDLFLENADALSSAKESLTKLAKLPYQASHQVELLHLQAETEALLQQLQTLKEQRSVTEVTDA
jgi:hypothetical protein